MRLKKLIVQGFKSFADRTEFVFDCPITGIVGPNGCGKSNVVDAFKWVLGEQSAKSLRGEAMMDVIFNGAAGRKPGNFAEVVLVFDNPLKLGGARQLNIDADEVSVGRRLFRDGGSEYQVNNHASRLKDVRELFLDTGIGVDAYSVIEQGKVDLLLQSNPQERRIIFEEAAGISKYKAKKKETQRKLEKVEQNLLRANDIVAEVEKRLRGVKIQAGRARVYQEHAQRLAQLRLEYVLREYHVHHGRLAELTEAQAQSAEELQGLQGQVESLRGELDKRRAELEQSREQKRQAEYQLLQTQNAIQSAQQQQAFAERQLAQLAEQRASFEEDITGTEARLGGVSQALEAETRVLEELTGQLDEQRRQIESAQAQFRDAQLQHNQLNQAVEGHKLAILDLMRKLAQKNNRLGAIEIERANAQQQQQRIGDRRKQVVAELESLRGTGAEQAGLMDQVVRQQQQSQEQMEQKRQDAASLGQRLAELSKQLGAAREHRSGLQSRQKLLLDLEARREGVSEAVKTILKRGDRYPFVQGLVADRLRVDVKNAQVIEAALDGRDQMLLVDRPATLAQDQVLEDLEGRVGFLCVDSLPEPPLDAAHPAGLTLASSLVQAAPRDQRVAYHLLGRTAVVSTLTEAIAVREQTGGDWRYVTLDGELLEPGGLRAGPMSAAMGLLSRRSELDALVIQIAEVESRIKTLSDELTSGNDRAKQVEHQIGELRNSAYQLNTRKVELSGRIAQNRDRAAALEREEPLLDKELSQLLEKTGRLKDEQAILRQDAQTLEADQSQRQTLIEQSAQTQSQLEEDLRALGERLTSARVLLGQVQEKQLSCRQQVQRQTGLRMEMQQQLRRLGESLANMEQKRGTVESEREAAERQRQEAAQALEGWQTRGREMDQTISRMQAQVQQAAAYLRDHETRLGEVDHQCRDLELQLSELRVRVEGLVQRCIDELQLELAGEYERQCQAAEGGEYHPAENDWNAVATEIQQLRDKIQRLGNVNLDSIGEQDELEQRQKTLSEQLADLANSRKQLEELIEQINAESSIRFEQTFNAVREHFQGMFRKLFGGGKADIYLETELPASTTPGPDGVVPPPQKVDVLDAGIEIIARPPGKQPVSISQLSGGEKTMTCVALLMSIFKSKPSPFCILDEVDAALDEANNQRFNLIVQEFLQQSQFIIITHSKRTMCIADVLYGVTMQEQGVSKRVAVKFDQVNPDGDITDTGQAAA